MPQSKEQQFAVESRRARVAEAYLKGKAQWEIVLAEKVDKAQISRDLDAVRKAWRESAVRDFDEDVNRELDRIDLLERTYWEAWERSRSERTRSRTKRRTGAAPSDEASVEKEQRDGNPAFLDGVMSCIDKRCKLLGLDAPVKHDHSIGIEERRSRVLGFLDVLRQRAGIGGDGGAPGGAGRN